MRARTASDAIGVLRRNPAFARVYTAQIVSFCGDWFAVVALQGLVLDLTGSAALAALLFAMNEMPFALASPVAGVVADRFDRRAVMIAADVARVGCALSFLLAGTEGTLWIAFAGVGGISVGAAFFEPASSAAMPNLVRGEDLATANVLMGSTWGTMLAVGAALGGVVTAVFGRDAAFIGDAASFVISAALLASVRVPFRTGPAPPPGRLRIAAGVREMLRFARAEPKVLSMLIVKGGFGVSVGVVGLLAVFATQVFGHGDGGIAVLWSARGVGALVGPFLFRRLFGTRDRALFRAIAVAFVVYGAAYLVFGLSPGLWVAAAAVLVAHAGGGAQWTMSSLALQRFSPDRIRGRVFAADYMLVTLTIGASVAAAGALAERLGPRPVAVGLAVLAIVWSGAWTLLTRRWWPATRAPAG